MSRSMMTWADWTDPYSSNISCSLLSLVLYDRFPTYNFLATSGLLRKKRNTRLA